VSLSRLSRVVVSVLTTEPKDCGFEPGQGDGFLRAIKIRSTPSSRTRKVPCRKTLRHVRDPLKSFGDGQAKFSFPSPISYCSKGVSGDGQSALVVKLGVSPSRSRLLTASRRYHLGIVQQAQGRSSETVVSPHHNNQCTIYVCHCLGDMLTCTLSLCHITKKCGYNIYDSLVSSSF
jgi:hypothetical protein